MCFWNHPFRSLTGEREGRALKGRLMQDLQSYVQHILDSAPALTEEKRDRLTTLFGGDAQ